MLKDPGERPSPAGSQFRLYVEKFEDARASLEGAGELVDGPRRAAVGVFPDFFGVVTVASGRVEVSVLREGKERSLVVASPGILFVRGPARLDYVPLTPSSAVVITLPWSVVTEGSIPGLELPLHFLCPPGELANVLTDLATLINAEAAGWSPRQRGATAEALLAGLSAAAHLGKFSDPSHVVLGGPSTYEGALAHIEAHHRDVTFVPEKLAELSNLSVRTLQRMFSERGATVAVEIERHRVDSALKILVADHERSLPLSVVARQVGLTSAKRLRAALKRHGYADPRNIFPPSVT